MEFNENDYVLGVWFAENENNDNFMMTVKTSDPARLNWEMEYRFRYISDDKIFDSKDKKSFYSGKLVGITEDAIIPKMDALLKFISLKYNKRSKFIEVKGGMDKFIFKISQEDFMHVGKIDK